MLTFLTTLIATASTTLVVDAVVETGPGTAGIRAAGRVLEVPASNTLWVAAAAGASVVVLWMLALWSFAGRRARRRAAKVAGAGSRSSGFESIQPSTPPLQGSLTAHGSIDHDRRESLERQISELRERVRTLSSDRMRLRDEARGLRRELGIPEPPPRWAVAAGDTAERPGPEHTGDVDAPVVLSLAPRSAPAPSRSRP